MTRMSITKATIRATIKAITRAMIKVWIKMMVVLEGMTWEAEIWAEEVFESYETLLMSRWLLNRA